MEPDKKPSDQLEENLKKAVTELILLTLLVRKECYIGELAKAVFEQSRHAFSLAFPYAAIYRMEREGYLCENGKRIAPDGRRRQYLAITDAGRTYQKQLKETYLAFIQGVSHILEGGKEK